MKDLEPTTPRDGISDRRLSFYSLLSGLCALLPLPFVDDWLRDRFRHKLAGEIAHGAGLTLTPEITRLLAVGEREHSVAGCARGCLSGAAVRAAFYVVSKLLRSVFRKLLFFLALNEAVDTLSRTYHQGFLLRHALGEPSPAPAPTDRETALRLHAAIDETCDEADPRMMRALARGALRDSGRLLRRAARLLARSVGKRRRQQDIEELELPLAEEERLLGGLAEELAARFASESAYWTALTARFDVKIDVDTTAAPAADPPVA